MVKDIVELLLHNLNIEECILLKCKDKIKRFLDRQLMEDSSDDQVINLNLVIKIIIFLIKTIKILN